MNSFISAYFWSALFWLGLPLGALLVLFLFGLTGGRWGGAILIELRALSSTLPVVLLLLVPLLFYLPEIYSWAQPGAADDPALQAKLGYLNPRFFIWRFAVYSALWLTLLVPVRRRSRVAAQRTQSEETLAAEKLSGISGPGAVLSGLALTFFSIDWIMSLEPNWYSTIYGFYYIVSYPLFALLCAVLLFLLFSPQRAAVDEKLSADLANLILALLLFWAYVSFSQLLIIWSGDLPEENSWYLHRIGGGWKYLALAVVLLHFAVPLTLLLFRGIKWRRKRLAVVAALLVLMRVADFYWWVVPGMRPGNGTPKFADALCFLTIAVVTCSVFCRSYLHSFRDRVEA
jgi:hypothetical protein